MMLRRCYEPSSLRDAWLVSLVVVACLGLFVLLFGSADVEESANSSYSSAAHYQSEESNVDGSGRQTLLGVPVYDTLQGTGDRLPYQASWGQSVTWWLRLFVDWNGYGIIRAMLFAIPGLWLCIRSLQSWSPNHRLPNLIIFGLLSSSSFGLNLRQNEWSDHFVQVVGVCAVSLFLMHRRFHDEAHLDSPERLGLTFLCLAFSINGVVTGHPGFWPIALAIWGAVIATFLTSDVFRTRVWAWVLTNRLAIGVTLGASLFTFLAVVQDLAFEHEGQSFGAGRLARTQGLFSEYAFGGLYGLSDGGSLPHAAKSVLASLLGTTLMPFFILFDGLLPQQFRASEFRELPRVEFTGSLIVFAIIIGWGALRASSSRPLVVRLLAAQAIIWLFVAGSAADALPAVLAASGAWMTLEVVLVFNVFTAWLVLRDLPRTKRAPRFIAIANFGLVGVWCLFQFGFVTFGSGIHLPKHYPSWFENADALAQTDWYAQQDQLPARSLLVQSPNFYDFLPFVALSQPMVASADPKTRASNQLQDNYAFNYSINSPTFERLEPDQIAGVLDFLQVRSVLVGFPVSDSQDGSKSNPEVIGRLGDVLTSSGRFTLPRASFDVYSRSEFSAFVIPRRSVSGLDTCPILQEQCALLARSTPVEPSESPKLTLCRKDCLWRFASPAIDEDMALVIPVTYDNTLVVNSADGTRLKTASAGGFLSVFGDAPVPAGELTIALRPDFRMWSRVAASYVNILMVLVLLSMMLFPKLSSLHRAREREPKPQHS